jgi:hypothetical protein
VQPLLEIALLPVAYAVLLLLTLQLFRFAGGSAATCIHALALDTKKILSYRATPVKPHQYSNGLVASAYRAGYFYAFLLARLGQVSYGAGSSFVI